MIKSKRYGDLEYVADVLKTIAHPVRLMILELLSRERSLSVGRLQKILGTKQSITSQHLCQMKRRGILYSRRSGNVVYYSITDKRILNIMGCIKGCKRR